MEKYVISIIVNPVNKRISLAVTLQAICLCLETLPKDSVIKNKKKSIWQTKALTRYAICNSLYEQITVIKSVTINITRIIILFLFRTSIIDT